MSGWERQQNEQNVKHICEHGLFLVIRHVSVSDTVALVEVVIVYKIPFLFSFCRVNEDESGNITMEETGSKPLKRDDLDSDVSLAYTYKKFD